MNAYPNTAAPGQTRECEAGNETYARNKQAIGNVPGNQGTETDEQGKEEAPSDGRPPDKRSRSRAGTAAG